MIILGLDCGTNNFGYSVIRVKTRPDGSISIKPIAGGLLSNPLNNLTHAAKMEKKRKGKRTLNAGKEEPTLEVGAVLFLEEIESIMDTNKVTHLAIERFQSRGRGGGSTIEAIGMMIGMILLLAIKRGIKFNVLIASTWKTACNRLTGKDILVKLYAYAKANFKREPHAFDAALMGIYAWQPSELARALTEGFMRRINAVQDGNDQTDTY